MTLPHCWEDEMRQILYYKDLYVAITIVILGEPSPENSASQGGEGQVCFSKSNAPAQNRREKTTWSSGV